MPHFLQLAAMNRRIWSHLGFWLAYWLLWGYLSGRYDLRFGVAYLGELVQLPAKLGATYFAFYWVTSRQGASLLHWAGPITMAVMVAVFVNRLLMFVWLHPAFYAQQYAMAFWDVHRIIYVFIDVGTVVALALAIKMNKLRQQSLAREQQLMQDKLASELLFLRAQMNPHFLFNTLNNLYALARRESPQMAGMLMRLSQLLRFILYDCAKPRIALSDEVKVMHDLMALERLRYGDKLALHYTEELDDPSQEVPPLLLLPFIENAFKHGAGENRFLTRIEINLRLKAGVLSLEVYNNQEAADEPPVSAEGLGLANVKRQLALLYPDAHQLEVRAQPDSFRVHLMVFVARASGVIHG